MTPQQTEKLNAALRSPYNLLGLSVGVALTAVFLDVRPIVVALAIEAVYLIVSFARPAKSPSARTKPQPVSSPIAEPSAPAPTIASAASSSAAYEPAAIVRDMPEVRTPMGMSMNVPRDAALPRLRRELQARYEGLEGALQMVKLVTDPASPAGKEIPAQLSILLDKYLFFALQEERLRDTLEALRDEARRLGDSGGLLPRTIDGKAKPGGAHLHLSSDALPVAPDDQWMQQVIREAHEYYERELADLAWRREQTFDPAAIAALERRSHIILRRNKYVDKVGKMLKNVTYTLQLIAKRFEVTTTELNERAPERILSDIKAIVLQAESMTRTVEDLEPFEELEEARVA
ncbi:hypothetical protein CCAX7_24570 [Capsulimonas corticalis]|uniref:Uncharacterized protein n=1 Tax=Capsulimonas corticalis TaxID=2219043 RepID=A0A402CVF3_9BACT|nr:hypothetical protein [Capsulimonas corticalis]BDI30406.1 hypothetical protein CCAX7_24570 [Capsulimonas corticalis]